jgi:hypothetical protein
MRADGGKVTDVPKNSGRNCSANQVLVAPVCNPSYSGGRDKMDHGSKPAWAKVHETLSQKYLSQKRAGGVA